jgi:aminoglycoside phosphotransferase (APT) family kinase protein
MTTEATGAGEATQSADGPPELTGLPQTSTRDPEGTRVELEAWLGTVLPDGAEPSVVSLDAPSTNGMSSETVLLDAEWREAGGDRRRHALVVRIAPDPANVPVFPEYDLDRQARTMRAVREHCDVPVPRVLWSEPDARVLGSPFFVMERIEGDVPPDILPYNMMSWVLDASPGDRRRMQDATVAALARLHAIEDADARFTFLPGQDGARTALARHVDEQRDYYEWVVADGGRSPLIERAFAWLDAHWPSEDGPNVLSWGDSRIGNVMYRDFEPVAVLDWEMASLGPAELDIGWLVTLHAFFEDVATTYELPGLPDFLRRDDVVAHYESLRGYTPRDLDWYCAYASTRHAIIMSRIGRRSIHFGEVEPPADIDELIPHRTMLEAMLAGEYWTVT